MDKIKNDIVEYLHKKNIDVYFSEYGDIIWVYKNYYTEFKIVIYFNDFYNYFSYSVNNYVKGIRKRRTGFSKHNNSHLYRIYKTLMYIKSELEPIAIKENESIKNKKRYCSELNLYFKRKHSKVEISTNENKRYDYVTISVSCFDKKFNNTANYDLKYKDKKYLLLSEVSNKEKVIKMSPLK